ncbi:DNA/RNA nuclease SfsA [Brevibacillus marinus]|uniref:DNA/RNA nuclease SfsA n=1 Tax=Brevibacillus marinus TaxID=2496837 RepID=UPI000F825E76|nr:DNA/RNA nuclease SfsA [Brevibacillus marinus]
MKYPDTVSGHFIRRINRFVAEVSIDGKRENVHVKNTGRLQELLTPEAHVMLEATGNPGRKTRYSLIAVQKNERWVNIDSQAPNAVVYEALKNGHIPEFPAIRLLRREVTCGDSRFDLYFEGAGQKGFIEVKGVTLERKGIALFPDAPTARGAKHIGELTKAVQAGYAGVVFFLVQMKGCHAFAPHEQMDKPFAEALKIAEKAGVQILAYDSLVTGNEIIIGHPLEVHIG